MATGGGFMRASLAASDVEYLALLESAIGFLLDDVGVGDDVRDALMPDFVRLVGLVRRSLERQ